MGLNLTHHDVNWIYNLHPEVKLISCLPDSNKGMNKDFLIVLGEWHDDLPYPMREGLLGGVFRYRFITSKSPFFFLWHVLYLFFSVCVCNWNFLWFVLFPFFFFFFPNGFIDKHATIPNFNLVNQPSLDKILKDEVFVHSDGQLWAVHLILEYNPLSSSFQALKYVIKAKDSHLHLINVAVLGFLNPGPGLRPQGVLKVEPFLQYKAEDETTPL